MQQKPTAWQAEIECAVQCWALEGKREAPCIAFAAHKFRGLAWAEAAWAGVVVPRRGQACHKAGLTIF